MMLTKQEAMTNFRKQWNWLADETERRQEKVQKEEYFKEHEIDDKDIPNAKCYCCEYDNLFTPRCSRCPVDWYIHDDQSLMCICSLYGDWKDATDWKEAARLAREIANLPENREKE